VTDQPSSRGLERHGTVAVHGRLEELSGTDVPEQDEADPRADGQDVALERHRPGNENDPGWSQFFVPKEFFPKKKASLFMHWIYR
jgi:hypothetical protein